MKVGLPSGLSAGQGVGLVLARVAAPYGPIKSFNDLPTPFRCVASDLNSGKGVILKTGSLFDALRATMSLPAFFAPVRKDKMMLVDGALTNNLPVDVVKGMGADYTIAVALGRAALNPADLRIAAGYSRPVDELHDFRKRAYSDGAADLVVMAMLGGMTRRRLLQMGRLPQDRLRSR